MTTTSLEFATAWKNRMLQALEGEHALARTVVEACPEDRLGYEPHEKSRSFGQLAVHLYATGLWFLDVIEKGGTQNMGEGEYSEPEPPATKADLLALLDRLNGEFLDRARALPAEKVAAKVFFFGMEEPEGLDLLHWHFLHYAHTRGQMVVYLRLMGAKVPATYGPSGDDDMGLGG